MKAPKSWKEVSIKQYYNLIDAMDLPLSDEDKAIAMLSALTDVSIESLNCDVDVTDLMKAINGIKFIGEDKTEGKARAYFKVGNRKFSFDMVLRDSNASSFISLSEYTKTPEISKKNVHNIIAVFCYELNLLGARKKRTISSQKEIAEYLKNNMNMNDAFLYRDFFLLSYKKLLESIKTYLASKHRKIAMELIKMNSRPL